MTLRRECLHFRKLLVVGVLLALSGLAPMAVAQNYTVEVRPELNGLDIKIETFDSPGSLVLKFTSNADRKVRCEMRYDAPPQPLYRTSTFVDPGKTAQSVFRAKRQWHRVEVDVTCTPVQ